MAINNTTFRTFNSTNDFKGMVNVRKQCIETDKVDTISTLEHFLSLKEMAETITQNHCEPPKDILIVELHGEIIGYCQIAWWVENDGTRLYLHVGYLIPQYRGNGIGTEMLHWCEKRIREIAYKHPTKGRAMYGGNASSTEKDKIKLLTENGYKPVFTQIEMEFNDFTLLKDYSLVNEFEIKPVKQSDLRIIWETINEVYTDRGTVAVQTEDDYREFISNTYNDSSLWQIAWKGSEIAALVLVEIKNGIGEITEVSTKKKFRRQGLAQTLLTKCLENLKNRGVKIVRLHTSGENVSGAKTLYEKIGFKHLKDYIRYRKTLNGKLQ